MLELKDISKKIGDFNLERVSFKVDKGNYFCLLGRSGAGKSMILEMIAGLKSPDKGSILLNGKELIGLPIHDRGIGLLFQEGLVFPHMTVRQNLGYALKSGKLDRAVQHSRIEKWAEVVGLAALLDRKPSGLSGGELKRVALARVLAMEPEVVLLDEPLSSLDSVLQSEMRCLLKKLNREGQTFLHVTHDFYEAYSLASEVAVLLDGRLVQKGTPKEVLKNPVNDFVRHLTGVRDYE